MSNDGCNAVLRFAGMTTEFACDKAGRAGKPHDDPITSDMTHEYDGPDGLHIEWEDYTTGARRIEQRSGS